MSGSPGPRDTGVAICFRVGVKEVPSHWSLTCPNLRQVRFQPTATGPARTRLRTEPVGLSPPWTKAYLSSVPAAGVPGRAPPPPTSALRLKGKFPNTLPHRINLFPARRVQIIRFAHPRFPLVTAKLADWLFPK